MLRRRAAEKAGVKAEDIISAVDGVDVTEMETSEVVDSCAGEQQRSCHAYGAPPGCGRTAFFFRGNHRCGASTVFPEMLDENTGYIRISSFSGVTCEQYQEAFAQLSEAGMEQLIIDLRGNPGGLLTSVCDICGKFCRRGSLCTPRISTATGRNIPVTGNILSRCRWQCW